MKITRSYYDIKKSELKESVKTPKRQILSPRDAAIYESVIAKRGNKLSPRDNAIYESRKSNKAASRPMNESAKYRTAKRVSRSSSAYKKLYEAVNAGPILPQVSTDWLEWAPDFNGRILGEYGIQKKIADMCREEGIGKLEVIDYEAPASKGDAEQFKLAGSVRDIAYWIGLFETVEFDSVESMEDMSDDELYSYIEDKLDVASDDEIEDLEQDYIASAEDDDEAFNAALADMEEDDDVDDEVIDDLRSSRGIEESVASRFGRYRKLYEEAEALNEKGDDEDAEAEDDDFSDIFGDDDDEEVEKDDSKEVDKDSDEGEETEDVPMTAVVLTVGKDDADKCKDEMIDAGIAEDDIEILDGEEDDENVKIKIDVNSVHELKDYLSGKGIDLEEKIGGEIVDDEEGEEKEEDSDKDEKSEEDEFADMDLGDIFGDDEEGADEGQE